MIYVAILILVQELKSPPFTRLTGPAEREKDETIGRERAKERKGGREEVAWLCVSTSTQGNAATALPPPP